MDGVQEKGVRLFSASGVFWGSLQVRVRTQKGFYSMGGVSRMAGPRRSQEVKSDESLM